MKGFLTEAEISLDSKGRFLLPMAIRKKLPTENTNMFVMARGFETNIVLYPMQKWETEIQPMLDSLSEFNAEARRFKMMFLNGATEVEMDATGRILISKRLLLHAGVEKDATLVANGGKIEIWDSKKYNKFFEEVQPTELSELADKLLGGNVKF
jgi:MraZ protein